MVFSRRAGYRVRECSRRPRESMVLKPQELAALPLFAAASPKVVEALARRGVEVRFARDEVLFLTGSRPRGWFVVLEGMVRVVRGTEGRQHVVHTEGVGGTLAEVPLVEGGTHPATGIALTDTRCALFTPPALAAAIAEEPRIAYIISSRLAARVRLLVDRLDERSARTVDGRLIEFLLARTGDGSSPTVTLGMTQNTLAEELGTVREVVARSLRGLCRQGLIQRIERGVYRVTDRRRLIERAREG
jgi:CRP/FNR family transcriptional regulator